MSTSWGLNSLRTLPRCFLWQCAYCRAVFCVYGSWRLSENQWPAITWHSSRNLSSLENKLAGISGFPQDFPNLTPFTICVHEILRLEIYIDRSGDLKHQKQPDSGQKSIYLSNQMIDILETIPIHCYFEEGHWFVSFQEKKGLYPKWGQFWRFSSSLMISNNFCTQAIQRLYEEVGGCTQASWRLSDLMRALLRRFLWITWFLEVMNSVPWGYELGSWRLWTLFLEVMEVILVFMLRSCWLYQALGGYGPAPSGYTTTSRYRAALAAKNERGTCVKSFKNCTTVGHCAHNRDSDIKTLFWRRTLYPTLPSCSA